MELNGIDMFYILWAITPFWSGQTEINCIEMNRTECKKISYHLKTLCYQ